MRCSISKCNASTCISTSISSRCIGRHCTLPPLRAGPPGRFSVRCLSGEHGQQLSRLGWLADAAASLTLALPFLRSLHRQGSTNPLQTRCSLDKQTTKVTNLHLCERRTKQGNPPEYYHNLLAPPSDYAGTQNHVSKIKSNCSIMKRRGGK